MLAKYCEETKASNRRKTSLNFIEAVERCADASLNLFAAMCVKRIVDYEYDFDSIKVSDYIEFSVVTGHYAFRCDIHEIFDRLSIPIEYLEKFIDIRDMMAEHDWRFCVRGRQAWQIARYVREVEFDGALPKRLQDLFSKEGLLEFSTVFGMLPEIQEYFDERKRALMEEL